MARLRRVLKRVVVTVAAVVAVILVAAAGLYAYHAWPVALPPAHERFELIAHRGVHQDFDPSGVTGETCTATRIYPPRHGYIENTLPSIRAAFDRGATVVEFDVQRTADDRLVVFHDATLECRTDGRGRPEEQPLASLKSLDVAYGYTADGGRTFPLRGSGRGMMPTLEEVLAAFPDRRLMINPKDNDPEIVRLLSQALARLPADRRERLSLWWAPEPSAQLRQAVPEVDRLLADRTGELRECAKRYLLRLGIGALPEACRGAGIAIPASYLRYVPGWPNRLLQQARAAGVPIYVETDDPEQARDVARLPINGVMTDRIETVAPALQGS